MTDDQLLALADTDPVQLAAVCAKLRPAESEFVLDRVAALLRARHVERARADFGYFARSVQEGYIDGTHLRLLTRKLNDVAHGRIKRLVVCIPPRHSKSRHSSELFPAYFLGLNPETPVMTVSHTADLSKNFGRFVRDKINDPLYRAIFPGTEVRSDNSAAGDWATTKGGKYYSAGVGGSLAGRGAGLLVVDDMVNEQTALQGQTRPEVYERIYDWYLLARQRLMPGGSIVIVNTRWAVNDPTGLILERSNEDWEVINLPAVWPADDKHPEERILWPEFWTKDEIFAIRDEMPPLKWEATYQQNPTAGGGSLVLPEWIRYWPKPEPPDLEAIVVTLDPAFSEKERADPSAFGVFGVFTARANYLDPTQAHDHKLRNIIALDMFETWANFPDLKTQCLDVFKKWRPDIFLIEDKASGTPLLQELAMIGLPVSAFKVSRGKKGASNDKISRLNALLPILKSGRVWFPKGFDWADYAIKQITTFPQVPHDDLCFPAGTLVRMEDGSQLPVETLRAGQFVATPDGPRRVLRAHATCESETVTVRHEYGVLTGTPNHPVWNHEENAYVRLDSLVMYNTLCLFSPTPPFAEKLSFSMENGTTAIPTRRGRFTGGTLGGPAGGSSCTETSGNITSGRYPRDSMFTTVTTIAATTIQRIWNVFQPKNIGGVTLKLGALWAAARNSLRAWRPGVTRRPSGTVPPPAEHGTPSILNRSPTPFEWAPPLALLGSGVNTRPTLAGGAASTSLVGATGRLSTARATTRTPTHGGKTEHRLSRVLSTSRSSAPVPVYNLSVEGAECYYADDVLVHNCDCLVMAMTYFRNSGMIEVELDRELFPEEDEDAPEEVHFGGYFSAAGVS